MSTRRESSEFEMMPRVSFPPLTPVVKRLLIAFAVVYLAQFALYLASGSEIGGKAQDLVRRHLTLNPSAWVDSFPLVPVWQVLTYGFLHAIEPMHVLMNGLMLYFFGSMLEGELGSRRFALTYLLAQIAGAVFFLVPALFGHVTAPALGASGACYGVMVAVATLHPRMRVWVMFIPVLLGWLAFGILILTVLSALIDFKQGGGGVAHLVHLGGIAYGFIAVRTGLVRKDPIEVFERRRAVARVEQAAEDEARMDQLLDKIHREGMGSLTRSEREFLKRASARK